MPVSFCGCSSVGRASAFQAEGRGSESRRPLHFCAPEGIRDRDPRGAGEGKNSLRHQSLFEVGKGHAGKPEGCSAGEAPLRRRGSESRRPLQNIPRRGLRPPLRRSVRRLATLNTTRSGMCLTRNKSDVRHEIGNLQFEKARVAQSVERVLGKDEVTSSILVAGSIETREKESV